MCLQGLPYLALLGCRMRGDAAAGSRAIAALAWCCIGLRSPGVAGCLAGQAAWLDDVRLVVGSLVKI